MTYDPCVGRHLGDQTHLLLHHGRDRRHLGVHGNLLVHLLVRLVLHLDHRSRLDHLDHRSHRRDGTLRGYHLDHRDRLVHRDRRLGDLGDLLHHRALAVLIATASGLELGVAACHLRLGATASGLE
ncbi:hypothetical protein GCM10011410_11240 [Hoyosella rhizosphaerae]|uniref:Uncharacterized protein n=1 Tax=Hoyosella rhizosphaerae TaxID=1755582 RepID=A0A916U5S9_9ACTN|nr:hypothetical protein GCM10011410_11240 [Hoyosella rhizosphaerae]